jgi:hypothetical protein
MKIMDNKKLTTIEYSILREIVLFYPYSMNEVEAIYLRCRSFDKTIDCIKQSLFSGLSLQRCLEELN